jgi:hypothetical protein
MTRFSYHTDTWDPDSGEVFVFGSNLKGIHGAGAARYAYDLGITEWGYAQGIKGDFDTAPPGKHRLSYALPTCTVPGQKVPLTDLREYIATFDRFVGNVNDTDSPPLVFFVTAVGTGLAGFTVEDVASIFLDCQNTQYMRFSPQFRDVMEAALDI